jgi:hypothetical protein
MLAVKLVEELLDIELLAEASVELTDAKLDRGTKLVERLDTLEHLAAELLLRCLRQGGGFGDCKFKRLGH